MSKNWQKMGRQERVDAVKAILAPGDTATPVARKLEGAGYYGFTLNQIVGLMNRNGMIGPNKIERRGARPKVAPRPKAKPLAVFDTASTSSLVAKALERLAPKPGRKLGEPEHSPAAEPKKFYLAKTGKDCAWPLWGNDPIDDADALMVCGAPVTADGQPWCAHHRSIAYTTHYRTNPSKKGAQM